MSMNTKPTMEEMLEQIKKFQKAQIDKPARAGVNSESSFVRYHLECADHEDAAKLYWSFACNSATIDDPEVVELQEKLDSMSRMIMPSWGTNGT